MRAVLLVVVCGCSPIFGLEPPTLRGDAGDAGDAGDVDGDARLDNASDGAVDMVGAKVWRDIERAFPSTVADDDPTLTADMLEMYIDRGYDLYVLRRSTTNDAWSLPMVVAELSTAAVEGTPEVSDNGLAMLFTSNRAGSMGSDIWLTSRSSRSNPWGTEYIVQNVNSPDADVLGSTTADTQTLVLSSTRAGGSTYDLYIATRPSVGSQFQVPVAISELNTTANELGAFISADGTTLHFDSDRAGSNDLYVTTRVVGVWGDPQPVAELNTAGYEGDPWLSPDGKTIYFASDRDGTMGIWTARRD